MRTLAEKLRLPAGRVVILNASPGQHRALGSPATSPEGPFDFVLLFVRDTAELRRLGPDAERAAKPQGLLWIAYPKGGTTRGVTDVPASPWWHRRDVLGEYTGETGYRPVAQMAIDDDWTALRFRHGTSRPILSRRAARCEASSRPDPSSGERQPHRSRWPAASTSTRSWNSQSSPGASNPGGHRSQRRGKQLLTARG